MIRPETKLPKISCRPKPKPTDSAAASHCSLSRGDAQRPEYRHRPDSDNRIVENGGDGVGGPLTHVEPRQHQHLQQTRQVADQRQATIDATMANNKLPIVTLRTTLAPASVPL